MKSRWSFLVPVLFITAFATTGCDEHDTAGLLPAEVSTDPWVFADDFVAALEYHAFENSYYGALNIDSIDYKEGGAALRFTIMNTPSWTGGAFNMPTARNLTGYNALAFWAKSSAPTSVDAAGFGVDVTGTSYNEVARPDIELDETWRQVLVPIPDASKLDIERGLFYVSDSDANADSIYVWFDEVRYVDTTEVTLLEAHMQSRAIETFTGLPVDVTAWSLFEVGADTVRVNHGAAYLDFMFTDAAVAAYQDDALRAIGAGSTTVTATLAGVPVQGTILMEVGMSPQEPAPEPTLPAADVISMFSDVYGDAAPVNWNTYWGGTTTQTTDLTISGDAVKVYTDLNWVGIEFTSPTIDVSEMTHFHMDIWVPAGTLFRVKLVDFGADGVFGTDDSEDELSFDAASTPALSTGEWVALEVPLTDFGITTWEHLAQMVLSGNTSTVFVDNVYFHK